LQPEGRGRLSRLDLNDPSTAVGGIREGRYLGAVGAQRKKTQAIEYQAVSRGQEIAADGGKHKRGFNHEQENCS